MTTQVLNANGDPIDYWTVNPSTDNVNAIVPTPNAGPTVDPYYATSTTYSGTPRIIDQRDNGDGTVTNYLSNGTTTTTTVTNGAQNVQTPDVISQYLTKFGNAVSGQSGTGAQLASLAGIYTLLNSLGGGLGQSGQGVYKGYTGGIPHYTATRAQYGVPQQQIGTFGATPGTKGLPNVTSQQFANYVNNPNINDAQIANAMNRYGINTDQAAAALGAPQSTVQNRYNAVMGPNAQLGPYRPGQGGITYFTPMQYSAAPATTTTAASGGLMGYAAGGGIGSLGSYSDGGRLLKGPGDGVSDSIPATIGGHQKAALADGEFVVPARIVSEIGNGSTDAGARKLYAMMDRIQHARKKTTKNVAADTKAEKYLPA
jgi:hypothetical protein